MRPPRRTQRAARSSGSTPASPALGGPAGGLDDHVHADAVGRVEHGLHDIDTRPEQGRRRTGRRARAWPGCGRRPGWAGAAVPGDLYRKQAHHPGADHKDALAGRTSARRARGRRPPGAGSPPPPSRDGRYPHQAGGRDGDKFGERAGRVNPRNSGLTHASARTAGRPRSDHRGGLNGGDPVAGPNPVPPMACRRTGRRTGRALPRRAGGQRGGQPGVQGDRLAGDEDALGDARLHAGDLDDTSSGPGRIGHVRDTRSPKPCNNAARTTPPPCSRVEFCIQYLNGVKEVGMAEREVIVTGIGGQGIQLLAKTLALAATRRQPRHALRGLRRRDAGRAVEGERRGRRHTAARAARARVGLVGDRRPSQVQRTGARPAAARRAGRGQRAAGRPGASRRILRVPSGCHRVAGPASAPQAVGFVLLGAYNAVTRWSTGGARRGDGGTASPVPPPTRTGERRALEAGAAAVAVQA